MALKDSIINLVLKGKDLISPATDSASESVGKLQERSDELNAALGKLNNTQKNIKEFKRLGDETERLEQNWRDAEAEVTRLKKAFQSTQKPTKTMARELERAEKSATGAKTAWLRNREAIDRLTPRLKAAGVNMRDLDRAQDDLEQSSRRLRSDLAGVDTQLKKQKTSAKGSGKAMEDAGKAAGGFTTRMKAAAAGLVAFIGVAEGLRKIRQGLLAMLQTGDRFEKLDDQLTQVFNSVEKGQEASQWIQRFTANTPLQLEQVSQAFIRLKNFGIDPTNGTLQALVDQNEAMGGTYQDLEGIINAVGQAWAKQKLQGEEILQLIERGVPVWELLAEATGKNVTELQSLSTNGELGRETIAALVQEIGKASQGAAAQSMGRLSGLVSNLKDQWDQFLNLIAESGSLDYVKGQLQELLATIVDLRRDGTLERWAQNISDGIVSIGKSLRSGITTVAEYKDELILLGKAFVAIKVAGAVKSLGAWTMALRASRAEMMAANAQAAATSRGFGALGRIAMGLAKPIPITLAIIGLSATTSALEAVTRQIHGVEDAQRRLALQEKEIELQRLREINQIKRKAEALKEYADVTVRTGAEVADMNKEQRQAYADQLDGAQQYYEYAIDALERQAAMGQDVSTELANMRGELQQVNQSLKTVSDEAIRAGEALRLGITKEALDSLVAFTKLKGEGLSTAEALQKSWEDLDLQTPEGVSAMSESLVKLVKTAQVTGEDIKEAIGKPLDEFTNEGLRQFQTNFVDKMDEAGRKSEQFAAVMDATLGDASRRLGVDINETLTGITSVGQAAIDSFGTVVENIDKAGRSAEENAKLIEANFTAALQKISTEKGLEQLQAKLREAAKNGLNVSKELEQVRKKLLELKTANDEFTDGLKQGVDEIKQGAKDASEEIDSLADTIGNSSDEAQEFKAKFRDAFGSWIDGVLTNARTAVSKLSVAARNLFEQKKGYNQFVKEAASARESLAMVQGELDRVESSLARVGAHEGFTRWALETEAVSLRVQRQFWSQAAAMENLVDRVNSGSYSMQELDNIAARANDRFDLLDSQRLSGLQSAIDSARSKLDSLNSSAESTLSSLRQRLADIRGDTEEAQRLQYEAERQRLQEQLRQAQKAGADEAAADYQNALDTLEQIYKVEQQNRKEEQNEREKKAADRAREQEMAELERQTARRASQPSPPTNQQASIQPVKTINVNLGGETFRVVAEDESALLNALEKARGTAA